MYRFYEEQLNNPKVFFVLNEIERIGCELKKPFFRCTQCITQEESAPRISAAYVLGSFDMPSSTNNNDDSNNTEEKQSSRGEDNDDDYPLKHLLDKPGVVLCEDVMKKYGKDKTLLLHELIHAYDDCRALINWSNCEQLACAEIRASALSGECDFKNERRRKNVDSKIVGGYQNCVRRRAALSLSMARACQNRNTEEIVDAVFKTCYSDVEPFARRP